MPLGRRLVTLGIPLLSMLSACAEPTREEVIARFDTGEKQVVVVYRGTGTNEELVERHTFDDNGEILLLEDLELGTTRN